MGLRPSGMIMLKNSPRAYAQPLGSQELLIVNKNDKILHNHSGFDWVIGTQYAHT